MTIFQLKRFLSRGRLAFLVAMALLATQVAVAQQDPQDNGNDNFESAPFGALPGQEDPGTGGEDAAPGEDSESTEPSEPEINLDAPRAKADVIDAYQVRLAETEYMPGRLRVLDPATGDIRGVRTTNVMIIQNGEIVERAETGVEGVAQIESLPVGRYAAIAVGPDGAAAFGFEVLPAVGGVSVPSYRFDALIVPGIDMAVAGRTAAAAPPTPAAPVPAPLPGSGAAATPAPSTLPPIPAAMVQEFEEPIGPTPADEGDQFAVQQVAAPLKGQPIVLRGGQPSTGQIVIPDSRSGRATGLANATVSFIREGQVLGTVTTDENGYCGVGGLEEGIYSMVGFGDNGFIALGIRVAAPQANYSPSVANDDAPSVANGEDASTEFVALLQPNPPGTAWRVGGAPSSALPFFPDPGVGGFPGGPGFPPPPGGGGMGGFGGGGGGFGGGGGGFGGGGLLGALLGAGLGAGIGAAIASDDDDNGDTDEGPVSPFLPPRGNDDDN